MYKVKTADGEKFLVQLVGPKSYRMGQQLTFRGGTLTVSKRTRDYLVRKTDGAWADFDPTPPEPIQEILPPQFGEPGGPMIDMEDIDPQSNPSLTMEQATQLAGKEVATNEAAFEDKGEPDLDPADLEQKPTAPEPTAAGTGDMTGEDLKGAKAPGKGGKTATASKKSNVNIEGAPKGAMTIS